MYGIKILFAVIASWLMSWGVHASSQNETLDAEFELKKIQLLLLSEVEMDSVVEKALNSSYALKTVQAEIASLQSEQKIESRNWMRSVALGVNLFGYNVTPSTLEQTSTTQLSVLSNASVTLLISPFELLGQKSRIDRAHQRVLRQQMVLENTKRELKILLVKKFLDYQSALKAYILTENKLMISDELRFMADEDFKRGVISNTEYNQILEGVLVHKLDLLEAENTVMKLKFELELMMQD